MSLEAFSLGNLFMPNADTSYILTRWVFLRLLGLVYLIAFISLWVQIKGLIGSNGILPIGDTLEAIRSQTGGSQFGSFPTIFWLNASDTALSIVCGLGALFSAFLIIGFIPMPSLIILWILYLSLFTAGRDFLSFQWDILLLEMGFLAIFLAPLSLLPGLAGETAVPRIILVLFWFLLFRFMFESGIVKLNSGDHTWKDLTALTFHYFSQPLPTWTSFYVHHFPLWFHKLSTLLMYTVELVLPFCILGNRTVRSFAVAGFAFLMVIITLTGNYTFFTLLTIALSITLLDDKVWEVLLPDKLLSFIGYGADTAGTPVWFAGLLFAVAIPVVYLGLVGLLRTNGVAMVQPRFIEKSIRILSPYAVVNTYGLFRVMTKDRPEIIVEGSNDGENWKAYEFKYKPGDLSRMPAFIEPHQPRLDWQMWFAALSTWERTPWFQNFLVRIVSGSPEVLKLMEHNPFSDAPPRYVRAVLYGYEFTSPNEKKGTGNWWKRKSRGMYSPVLSLTQ